MHLDRACWTVFVFTFLFSTPGLSAQESPVPGTPLEQLVAPGSLVPVTCFAEGTSPELVAYYGARQPTGATGLSISSEGPGLDEFQFPDGGRWSSTVQSGSGLTQGDPTIITWSIVPDGTSVYGYIGEPSAPSNLRAYLNGIYGNEAAWLPIFEQVFARWGALTGNTYVRVSDDGSAWTSSSIAGGQAGVRGDVRIAGHAIDGNSGVLAYNFFPNIGDMVIDTSDNTFTNTAGNSLRLRNMLAHEHGHGLGIRHVCPISQTKLMEPFLTTAFDGPQFDDILAGNRGYGDFVERNDTPGTAEDLGSFGPGSGLSIPLLSIDDNGDPDYYRFNVSNASKVTVSVNPQGTTYLSGPQNTNGSCSAGTSYNSRDNHDLSLRILAPDGTTPLATADGNGYSSAEVLTDVDLPGAGTYYVQVLGSADDQAQLYELSLDVAETGVGVPTLVAENIVSSTTPVTRSLNGFQVPRIVMGPPSINGAQPVVTRLRNIFPTSFQHHLQEWEYLDGYHNNENVSYLALEDGPQNLGSLPAEAGSTTANHLWKRVFFTQSFDERPVVLSQLASFNGAQAATVRIRNINRTGFDVLVQEEEAADGYHNGERVDWIAVRSGVTVFGNVKVEAGFTGPVVTHNWHTVSYSGFRGPKFFADIATVNGPDPSTLRRRNLGSYSVQIKIEEEQSADAEVAHHAAEGVGYVVIGGAP